MPMEQLHSGGNPCRMLRQVDESDRVVDFKSQRSDPALLKQKLDF